MKTIDTIAHIRNHPEMYLPQRGDTGVDLTLAMASDVLINKDSKVIVIRIQDWWVVASEVDWIAPLITSNLENYFEAMTPFPEAGPNSMHSEVLLTAFAKDVITIDVNNVKVIKGSVSRDESVLTLRDQNPQWMRIVAFRLGAACNERVC